MTNKPTPEQLAKLPKWAQDAMQDLEREKDEAVAACETIMDAIAGHTDWHPSPHVDEDNWNEEAHVEPTITVADCRALKEVLRKAGKLEQYMP